jgi:hypothetical protein
MPTATIATAGMQGFDVDSWVSPAAALRYKAAGYTFALRYLTRTVPHPSDLSTAEIAGLHAAGLAVGAVQHVESESSWVPSAEKGTAYGQAAATEAATLGLQGTTVFCDLEGVAPQTPWSAVADYCRAWFDAVNAGGFQPGLYVGWHCGLDATQLYDLPFTRFWGALNLNEDQFPVTRGLCMKQHAAKIADDPVGLGIDTNTVQTDALGGLPTFLFP